MAPKRPKEPSTLDSNKKPRTTNHWSLGLLDSMSDPNLQIESDELIVIIKDKYPKAKFHYLILPHENISSLKKLTRDSIPLLEQMESAGKRLINQNEHVHINFKFGYHAEASMQRLHLHVISDDMDSECLKTKKHWNTFTTAFFLKPESVREQLEKNGKVLLPSSDKIKELLNTPLVCHKCDYKPKNIPALKNHIKTHLV